VHTGGEVGAKNDVFKVFLNGRYIAEPVDNAAVWMYISKDGLRPPRVVAEQEFRKAVEESEKAAAQRQPQKQQEAQKNTRKEGTDSTPGYRKSCS